MTVYLVGAGPGDPGPAHRAGRRAAGRADVVVHDRLSAAELLDLAPPHAERIDVGKAPGPRRVSARTASTTLLVEHGRAGRDRGPAQGRRPVRVRPWRRGGGCARAAGVAYEVVPGITSALAVPAYAGIPVTLRYSSTSFTVVTGHEDPDRDEGSVDWQAVARVGGTIIVLMGVARWPAIAAQLLAGGLPADTPVAAVRWGTRPEQRTVRATLATLDADDARGAVGDRHRRGGPPGPRLVRAAAAVRHADRRHPVASPGLAARAAAGASSAPNRSRCRSSRSASRPTVARRCAHAVARLPDYDWLVLTSPNGVERTFAEHPRHAACSAGVQVAAIGPGTAEALARYRVVADLVPERFVAEALLSAFPDPPAPRRSGAARPGGSRTRRAARRAAGQGLGGRRRRGVPHDVGRARAAEQRAAVAGADLVTFTSSSTVDNFVDAFGVDAVPPVVACIGPVTAATARRHGLTVSTSRPPVHTIDGLVDAHPQALDAIGTTGRVTYCVETERDGPPKPWCSTSTG